VAVKKTPEKSVQKRVPLQSVLFSDSRGKIQGFANSWFFWVHEAFKDALDIRVVERIDREKTDALRETKAQELSGLPLAELRRGRKVDAKLEEQFQTVMKATRMTTLETEGIPPTYTFRATDSFESRCGRWYIQVAREGVEKFVGMGDDTKISYEELGVMIYRESANPNTKWQKYSSVILRQFELVQLLKTGRAGTINLTADEATATAFVQFHLI
jgi:hypothetical protein